MTTELFLDVVFIVLNTAVLMLIWHVISKWVNRCERKIDELDERIRYINEYINHTTHVVDSVYIDMQSRLIENLAKEERYEEAEFVRKNREKTIDCVLSDMENQLTEMKKKVSRGKRKQERQDDQGGGE